MRYYLELIHKCGYSSIRDAGGKIAERGKVLEEEYFLRQNRDLLLKLKQNIQQEIEFHEQQVKVSNQKLHTAKEELQRLHNKEPYPKK